MAQKFDILEALQNQGIDAKVIKVSLDSPFLTRIILIIL